MNYLAGTPLFDSEHPIVANMERVSEGMYAYDKIAQIWILEMENLKCNIFILCFLTLFFC